MPSFWGDPPPSLSRREVGCSFLKHKGPFCALYLSTAPIKPATLPCFSGPILIFPQPTPRPPTNTDHPPRQFTSFVLIRSAAALFSDAPPRPPSCGFLIDCLFSAGTLPLSQLTPFDRVPLVASIPISPHDSSPFLLRLG